MTKYDSIDIFFITMISIYLITLVLFLITLIIKELNKNKQSNKIKQDNKRPKIKKTTIKNYPLPKSNLLINKHYKHNISYLKNN